ncbi:MAG: molybdopterin molybdotransferase MoeA, partial [Thiotrichales bacterium]
MPHSTIKQKASCADDYDRESLTVERARRNILAKIGPVTDIETLTLYEGLNRVLAQDIVSDLDVPGHTNSAMDGYALAGDDLPDTATRRYSVIGTAYAGQPFKGECHPGECVRIMTGAAMPAGCDTVVMQEHVEPVSDTEVRIASGHRKQQNVRQAGEDISRNSMVLPRGHALQPADLGVIASVGVGEISVYRRPKIAFFSTGDELRPVGETLDNGELYDSNRYSLHGMLSQL